LFCFVFVLFLFLFSKELATVDWFEERLKAPERGFARSAYLQGSTAENNLKSCFNFLPPTKTNKSDRAAISSMSWTSADQRDT
jgi:hypothetical protein